MQSGEGEREAGTSGTQKFKREAEESNDPRKRARDARSEFKLNPPAMPENKELAAKMLRGCLREDFAGFYRFEAIVEMLKEAVEMNMDAGRLASLQSFTSVPVQARQICYPFNAGNACAFGGIQHEDKQQRSGRVIKRMHVCYLCAALGMVHAHAACVCPLLASACGENVKFTFILYISPPSNPQLFYSNPRTANQPPKSPLPSGIPPESRAEPTSARHSPVPRFSSVPVSHVTHTPPPSPTSTTA